ncbi:binary toxin-like calcium binding domain-containing protein, partial [Bacillus mycoides]
KKDSNLSLEERQLTLIPSLENETVRSARWLGFIKPKTTDEYIFSTPFNHEMLIQIGNQIVNLGRKITLEKDKVYPIRIESKFEGNANNIITCELYWSYSGKKEIITQGCLLVPDLKNTEDYPQTSLFGDVADDNQDSDKDYIPDDWEINGYTYIGASVVAWSDDYEGTYTKYVSNPYQMHTVADPYTDLEKVSGQIDRAISREAWNPLVAAYPVVGVGMEELILSSTENFTTTENHTTASSKTESNTEGASFDGGASQKDGLFGGITGNYSHTTSTTNSTEDSSGTTTQINKGDSGYLNANVRYYNAGSAPIYQVTPTTNFVLDGATINTITVPYSNIGDSLVPNSTYPAAEQHAIALTTIDGSTPITINYDELTKLQQGENLILETTQTAGLYGTYQDGNFVILDTNDWDPIVEQIKACSASFILDTGSEVLERAVAAKDYTNPNDFTPEATVGDAIYLAFGATKEDNLIYYKDTPIYESAVELVYDENTASDIQEQLDNSDSKSVYEMKIKPGMNILIKCPEIFDDANGASSNSAFSWTHVTTGQAGVEGTGYSVNSTSTTYGTWNLNLEQDTRYILSMYVKTSDNNEHQIKLGVGNGDISTYTLIQNYTVNNEWQRIEFEFNPAIDISKFKGVALQSIDGSTIYFDDIAITKLNPQITEESIQEAHTVQSWNEVPYYDTGDYTLNGVFLHVEPDIVCDYKLVANDEDEGTQPGYPRDTNGNVQVNFTEYGGEGFFPNTHIQVYAVYPELDPVLVAEWLPDDSSSLKVNPLSNE